jgi:signal transduction histidine kinase
MGLRVLSLLLLVLASASAAALSESKRILLLGSFRSALPANRVFAAGIRDELDLPPDIPVEIDTDTLNLTGVHDEEYLRKLIETYRLKYRASPPSLVVAIFMPAVRLFLDHRRELFPGIPIVLCFTEFSAQDLEQLPPDVTGVVTKPDFAGTLELMSRLHSDLRRIALIVGSSDVDALREQEVRKALQPLGRKFEFTWLRGLPLRELTETVRALPSHTAILYVLQLADRNGLSYVPRNVAKAVAESASVPVYGLWDTLIGAGIVGGRVISFEQQGVAVGKIVRRILMGEAPEAIPVLRIERNPVVVDARQLKRWNIDERLLPEDSRILNRVHALWQDHRNAILVASGLIALQALWITALLWNRKRLRLAQTSLTKECDLRAQSEELIRRLQTRLGAADKQSTLGALAGRIAHEINQPLIAIKNYAQAAKRYVPADSTKGGKLSELLAEMEGEADRAGTIIRKIRTLLSSGQVDAVPVELDPVLKEVLSLMQPEADAHGCRVDYRATTPVPVVLADALHVQLVMVNLLRNAIEAAASNAQSGGQSVSITVCETADQVVQVTVTDSGPGVPPEEVEDIFESLYSTKAAGMGVGLATSQRIIEAHGGRIWCAPNPEGGAIFHFTIPAAEAGG